jgi:pimeloyl-ACP methyl ester carboxylesterase
MKGGILALAAGLLAGAAAEQLAVRQPWRPDPYREENFGQVRGEPHWLRASDGTELYVEVHPCDDPQAPTIVFAHGYCLNQDSWHFQRKALLGKARMVLWDQRNHGRSERGPLENSTIEQLGRDLQYVLDAFTQGPVVLAGHSMGGMTIMALAAQFPETFLDRVKGVAFVATSAGELSTDFLGLPPGMAKRAEALAAGVRPNRVLLGPVQRARYTDLNFAVTKRGSFGRHAPNSLALFTLAMLNATSLETVVDFLPTLLAHNLYDALKVLDEVPVWIVVGESDLLTPVAHTTRLMELLPHAESTILPDTGHMIELERNEEVTEGIRRLAFD